MSRWIDGFENHAFQGVWKQILEEVENVSANDETVATDVKEISRLKKVVSYIDELLRSADPELIPLNTWNNFQQQATNVLTQVRQYIQNKNIGHIQNANNHSDNLLTYVRPYVLSGKGSAQAAGRAFKEYSKTVTEHIDILSEKAKTAVVQAEENKSETDAILQAVEEQQTRIRDLADSFLDGDDNLRQRLEDFYEEVETWHTRISEYHNELTAGNEEESSIVLQIEEAKKQAIENAKSTKGALDSSASLLDELEQFSQTIFGKQDRNGKRQGGLREELNIRRREIEQFKQEQSTTYKTLLDEIEGLIPGATSAGLATAYKEMKDKFDTPIRNFSIIFYFALALLFILAFVFITDDFGLWYINFVKIDEPKLLLNNLFFKLPILLPVLWLAIFASKRRSEDRRLQQEYAHKEALAKSYESFRYQIDALKTDDEQLKKQLLERSIAAIAFNASITLDGKHGDKLPLLETIDKLAEKKLELSGLSTK